METRGPQSVPKAHVANLEPGPPLPPALRQLFVCTMAEECGAPQSTQSVPYAHVLNSELGPPSKKLVVVQMPVPARKEDGPRSAQSVPYWPLGCSAPGLPVIEGGCSDGGEGEVAPRKS